MTIEDRTKEAVTEENEREESEPSRIPREFYEVRPPWSKRIFSNVFGAQNQS